MMHLPYYIVKFACWLILRLGFGLEVRGQNHVPTSGGFLLACNHASYLDPPVLGSACPRRVAFMARWTLYRHPLMRWFNRAMHCIPLDRDEGGLKAIREAARRLQSGEGVGIFPEGRRQWSGDLGEAKRGVGLVAAQGRVPIIPVLIHGTFKVLPRGVSRLRRAKIRVAFGPQIAYTEQRFSTDQPAKRVSLAAHHEALAQAVTQSWRRLQGELDTRES